MKRLFAPPLLAALLAAAFAPSPEAAAWDGRLDDPAAYDAPLDATSPVALERLEAARFLIDDGDAAGAARLLAAADRPATAEVNLLGAARSLSGDRAGAKRAFRAALDADPAFVAAAVNLGHLLHRERDHDALERLARSLAAVRPGDGDALLGLGLAAYGRREYGRAIPLLERARDALDRAGNPRAGAAREFLRRASATRRRAFARPAPDAGGAR